MPLPPSAACAMSGKRRYVLDTNAIVALLAGNQELLERCKRADYIGISVISYLEFLVFDGLSDTDRKSFESFCARVEVVPLPFDDALLLTHILELRRLHRLKLPDAIIGATAISRNAHLITNDSHFSGISFLTVRGC